MTFYDPKKIEAKWQKHWEKEKTFSVKEDSKKKKFYSLIEFPYPSGEGLHVGHPRALTAMDAISRKRRMEGYNVLYPIGFDAFGLPTENFAIKTKQQPAVVTKKNIANFTRQLKSLGYSFDWDRVIDTSDPKYYKWTQWLFLQFFKHGLAYKKNQPINWCPKDKIGLANEEVVNGCCERCGTAVEQRNKEQWMLGITKYAEKLLDGLKEVDYITPARVQQENWIGKSEGAEIQFSVIARSEATSQSPNLQQGSESQGITTPRLGSVRNDAFTITVFTTRPDTLFGVTFLAVSVEMVKQWAVSGWKAPEEVQTYCDKTLAARAANTTREEVEKTGVATGFMATNPANGEVVPVWVTNYVLGNVGTGAVMGVPAHDERDFEFAKEYQLPIREVIEPETGKKMPDEQFRSSIVAIVEDPTTSKFLTLNWGPKFGGTLFIGGGREEGEDAEAAARREIAEETGYTNIELVAKTGRLHHHYFAFSKNVARNTEVIGLHFRLSGKEQKDTDHQADEKNKFTPEWITKAEVKAKMEDENHLLVFSSLVLGEVYTGKGIITNSKGFDGMDSEEAKKKITAAVGGQMKTNYKLRDWVFSRQRYWGEPIPLVYCETCATKKKEIILLHAYKGSSQDAFLPKLKQLFEEKGYKVSVPDLPNPINPNIDEQVKFVLDNFIINENTILIGHSLGAVVVLKLLERIKGKIASAILVAPPVKPEFRDGKKREALEKCFDWKFDFEKIKEHANLKVVMADINDHIVLLDHGRIIASGIGARLVEVVAPIPHFDGSSDAVASLVFENALSGEEMNPGWIPIEEKTLPLELPKVDKYEPTDSGESPLAPLTDWVNTKCPRCGGKARRETDTMPNWAGSSWYFLRYTDSQNDKEFASMGKMKYWMDVDWYNGGMEHTVLHLLYSRFWNIFLHDIGLVPTSEPYKKRTSHGMILGPDGEKMSKSRGNVINPDEMQEKFGTDALRAYIMFMGPFDQAVMWDTNGLVGVRRFLDRTWSLQDKITKDYEDGNKITTLLHQTIKKVSSDIDEMHFNTAIAKMMELVNELMKEEKISEQLFVTLLKLLSPFAPHFAEELSSVIGAKEELAYSAWPSFDPQLTLSQTFTLAVQVNGKLRDTLEVATDITEDKVKELVLQSEKVQKWLEGKTPKKIIYVKGKLVSVVV